MTETVDRAKPSEDAAVLREQLVRLAADFENVKRRTAMERDQVARRARDGVLVDVLEVLDSLDRAEGCCHEANDWQDGFQQIKTQLKKVLTRHHLTAVEPTGERFDPAQHEAIATVPSDQPAGTVVVTERAGYAFADGQLLRPARVVVAQ